MSRKTWRKDSFSITYGRPHITPYEDDVEIESMRDVMYFYYDIDILDRNKVLFSTQAHDFPKIQSLPYYIDDILAVNECDMLEYENYTHNDFCRRKLYTFVVLEDAFNFNHEYFYKIERTITYVKRSLDNKFERYEEFDLTIGESIPSENSQAFGKSIFIKNLTREDILYLKSIAEEFCKCAIEDYNKCIKNK